MKCMVEGRLASWDRGFRTACVGGDATVEDGGEASVIHFCHYLI